MVLYRERQVVPGTGPSQKRLEQRRKQKNVVTFGYNMTIWLAETISAGLVVNTRKRIYIVENYFSF